MMAKQQQNNYRQWAQKDPNEKNKSLTEQQINQKLLAGNQALVGQGKNQFIEQGQTLLKEDLWMKQQPELLELFVRVPDIVDGFY